MGTPLIITDVRFENEADWIRKNGGHVIHLTRGEAPAVREHASEAGVTMGDGDYAYQNDGSLPDLAKHMGQILGDLLHRRAA